MAIFAIFPLGTGIIVGYTGVAVGMILLMLTAQALYFPSARQEIKLTYWLMILLGLCYNIASGLLVLVVTMYHGTNWWLVVKVFLVMAFNMAMICMGFQTFFMTLPLTGALLYFWMCAMLYRNATEAKEAIEADMI